MPGQLTCGNCGHSWWSSASSPRTRCGGCRSVVTVPAGIRNVTAPSSAPRRTGSTPGNQEPTVDDSEGGSGLVALVVLGICQVAVLLLFRSRKAPRPVAPTRRPSGPSHVGNLASPRQPAARLAVGTLTRWSCGHEADLQRPLPAGVTVVTSPCPLCGRPGITGQIVAGTFLSF